MSTGRMNKILKQLLDGEEPEPRSEEEAELIEQLREELANWPDGVPVGMLPDADYDDEDDDEDWTEDD